MAVNHEWIWAKLRRGTEGLVLVFWMLSLVVFSLDAFEAQNSSDLYSSAGSFDPFASEFADDEVPPDVPDTETAFLEGLSATDFGVGTYLSMRPRELLIAFEGFAFSNRDLDDPWFGYSEPPPIGAVLDDMLTGPSWQNRSYYLDRLMEMDPGLRDEGEEVAERALEAEYYELFRRMNERMLDLAEDEGAESADIVIDTTVLPQLFRPTDDDGARRTSSVTEMTAWVTRERARMADQREVEAQFAEDSQSLFELQRTFQLLIVLGALGSVIFLTRDFIRDDEGTGLAAYIFRPVLGVFLAMGMFVVDLFAHTVVSEASLLEVRNEPLLVLAFAAGLLSEQAYAALESRTKSALARYRIRSEEASDDRPPEPQATPDA